MRKALSKLFILSLALYITEHYYILHKNAFLHFQTAFFFFFFAFDNCHSNGQYIYNYILPQSPLNIKRPEHSLIGWLKFRMKEEVIMID